MSGTDPKRQAPPMREEAPVIRLKEQISARTYRIDSRAVAREMLFKMRMMAILRDQPRQTQRRS
jgi:anti-sigma28 factor (negative regulator of flagellin synthesis)